MAHPRAQHPSCHCGSAQCAAGFTNVYYISMEGDGRGEAVEGCQGVVDPSHLGGRTREEISLRLTHGVNIVSEMK